MFFVMYIVQLWKRSLLLLVSEYTVLPCRVEILWFAVHLISTICSHTCELSRRCEKIWLKKVEVQRWLNIVLWLSIQIDSIIKHYLSFLNQFSKTKFPLKLFQW